MIRRGAAMLYSVILSLVVVAIIAGLSRFVGASHNATSRAEKELRARALADLQLAVLRSRGKSDILALPASFDRTVTGVRTTGSATVVPSIDGLVQVDQSVRVGGTQYFFRDYVAIPTIQQAVAWATVAWGSDNWTGGLAGSVRATGPANNDPAAGGGTPAGRSTLSVQGFSQQGILESNQIRALLTGSGLVPNQLAAFEFIAINVRPTGSSQSFANSTWEFWKGNRRLRIAPGDSLGSGQRRWVINAATFQTAFNLPTLPSGREAEIVLFDFNLFSGGNTLLSDPNQFRAINFSEFGTNPPNLDAAAWLRVAEATTLQGLALEMGIAVRNGEGNAFSTVVTRVVSSCPFEPGSGTTDVPVGSIGDNWASWGGTVIPIQSGGHRFRVVTDDGSRLWINNWNVVSAWWPQGPTSYASVEVPLNAGVPVPFWYEWWDWGGMEARRVEWLPPGGSWQLIPDSQLRPGQGTVPVGRGFWGFSDGVSTGWTWSGLRSGSGPWGSTNPTTGIVNNQFLGDFGGSGAFVTLSLGSVPAGQVFVLFEVQRTGSWESTGPNGPDRMQVQVNGSTITQWNLWTDPTTEVSSNLPLLSIRSPGGGWHLMRCEFVHTGGNLAITLRPTNPGNEVINNESFIVDNVTVRRKL